MAKIFNFPTNSRAAEVAAFRLRMQPVAYTKPCTWFVQMRQLQMAAEFPPLGHMPLLGHINCRSVLTPALPPGPLTLEQVEVLVGKGFNVQLDRDLNIISINKEW